MTKVRIMCNAGVGCILWFASLAPRETAIPCGSVCMYIYVCVWSGREKDCITEFEHVLRNDCSLTSLVAAGHTDIQRGKPYDKGFDHVMSRDGKSSELKKKWF